MARWRIRGRRPEASPEVSLARDAFGLVLGLVERAKEELVSAAPRGRSAGVPVAEALAACEEILRRAEGRMAEWRLATVESEWLSCSDALGESLRRAEWLRLEAQPEGYEELYGALGDVLDPLEAFEPAAEAVARLGRG